MRIPSILLALALLGILGACRESTATPRVTVAEIDSTGQLPEGVDPDLYNRGRSVLLRQKEAADKLAGVAEQFAEFTDTIQADPR